MTMPTSEELNRMVVEISAGWEYGDPRSKVPQSAEIEASWMRLKQQMDEIAAQGGIVEIPGEFPDLTGYEPARRSSPSGPEVEDSTEPDEAEVDLAELELPSRDRPSWGSLDVGRFGYPLLPKGYFHDQVGEQPRAGRWEQSLSNPESSPDLTTRFTAAVKFAWGWHSGQFRKGTAIPYISHPLAVASLAIEDASADAILSERLEDIAVAALLHDLIEDTGATATDIEEAFGPEVARIVVACSDRGSGEKEAWEVRKRRYVEHLEGADDSVLCVSLADKRHNARSIVTDARAARVKGDLETFWKRFNAGPDQQAGHYRALSDVFLRRRPGAVANEFLATVDELVALAI